MKRRLSTLAAAASLLLCLASIALSVASYSWQPSFARYSRSNDGVNSVRAGLRRGRLILARSLWCRGGEPMTAYTIDSIEGGLAYWDVDGTWLGFGWRSD